MEGEIIKSQEDVVQLIKELWIRHKLGQPMPANNLFFVGLPEPNPDEIKANSDSDNWYYIAPTKDNVS